MSVVVPNTLDFGRMVLNLISYFFTVYKLKSIGVDISFLQVYLTIGPPKRFIRPRPAALILEIASRR
jgi:hypothetical protein